MNMNYPEIINNLKQQLANTSQQQDSVIQQIKTNEDILGNLGFLGDAPETEEKEDLVANTIETQQEHLMKEDEKLTSIAEAQAALIQAYNLLQQYHSNH
jgi:hypothetical protein